MADIEFAAYLRFSARWRLPANVDPTAVVRRGTIRQALRACQSARSPNTLLVDLDGEANPMPQVGALLQVCRPETTILATGSENSVTLANDLYRGGVFLYLPKPLDANNLRNALREVISADEEQERPEVQASHVMLMHGKGMGVNTVTALLAHIAASFGRYVSCLDLNANFGTLALTFDTEPERGLAQALQDPQSINADTVERLQARVTNRIGLLAYPVDHVDHGEAHFEGLGSLVTELASHAHLILVCGTSMEQFKVMLNYVTNHVIVFEPTPVGVSIASRWLRLLQGARSSLVMNHARPLPKLVGESHLRSAFGNRPPDAELPYIRGMAEAMMLGDSLRSIPQRERQSVGRFLQSLLGVGAADQVE
ncbi:MAG: hypothetical protein OXJ53_12515 [Gammaproteobacteria bacterium]|nr:hypothetical protein [Gammaproteobacteria bacterium]